MVASRVERVALAKTRALLSSPRRTVGTSGTARRICTYTFSRLAVVGLGTGKVCWVHVELEGREGGKEHILVCLC